MGGEFGEVVDYFLKKKGQIIGLLLGLLVGLAVMKYGIWKTLFLALCAGVGYFLGKRVDDRKGFEEIIDRFFPYRGRSRR